MKHELVEELENGNINIKIYNLGESARYWIRAGQALIELDEQGLDELFVLLSAIYEEL